MIKIYSSQDMIGAQIFIDYLNNHGIHAEIKGSHLVGLQGLVPLEDSSPSVWVLNKDLEKAKALLELFLKSE